MFKKRISERDARQATERATMRRALYGIMWRGAHNHIVRVDGGTAQPRPVLSDEKLREELRRILGIGRSWWTFRSAGGAKKVIEEAEMRRALYEMLWAMTHKAHDGVPAQPCPSLDDEEIKRRLRRLLR